MKVSPFLKNSQIHNRLTSLAPGVKIKIEVLPLSEIQKPGDCIKQPIQKISEIITSLDDTTDTLDLELILDKDNKIIDGHHRYTAAMLLNPNYKVTVVKLDNVDRSIADSALRKTVRWVNTNKEVYGHLWKNEVHRYSVRCETCFHTGTLEEASKEDFKKWGVPREHLQSISPSQA